MEYYLYYHFVKLTNDETLTEQQQETIICSSHTSSIKMSQSTFLICESINHKIVYILKSYWQVMPIDQQPYSKSFDTGICTSINVYHHHTNKAFH
jgi:hypothetical protein